MNSLHTKPTCTRRGTKRARSKLASVLWRTAMALAFSPVALGANPSGALRVEVVTAYNLVVDSNVESPSTYAPRAAFIGARVWNDGATDITDVFAFIGDYTNNLAGEYPKNRHPAYPTIVGPLTGPSGAGYFALTHEGGGAGKAEATRYLGTIRAGQYVPVYWLVSYPNLDINGHAVWGPSVKPDDDLWLTYNVWAKGVEGATPRTAVATSKVTMRNEISASANKIDPNTANQVPDEYQELLQQYVPTWYNDLTVVTPGGTIKTKGVWYNLGNVGFGFDNNGDMVPDHNAWMQPVGDPTLFDAGYFRLIRTYAVVIVKLKGGGLQVIPATDQLYFENIPENTMAFGWVTYEFLALNGATTTHITPYQEVASGYDNEKFCGDFGAGNPSALALSTAQPDVGMGKTASVATVGLGGTIQYTLNYTNTGGIPVGNPAVGVPLVVNDSIPPGTTYVAGSATNNNTLPGGVVSYKVLYSSDNRTNWTTAEPSPASLVTDLQWWLSDPLPASAVGIVRFSVTVKNPYTGPSPLIVNTGSLSYGSGMPVRQASAQTLLQGNNTLSGTVFNDNGAGGGGFGNALMDGGETGLANIQVSLYYDKNGDGAFDSGDVLVAQANSAANGTYSFANLFDGKYVAVVDTSDADLPTGSTPTTVTTRAADLDSAGATTSPVTSSGNNFGFAPAFLIDKKLVGTSPVYEGTRVTNTIDLINRLPGDGSGQAKGATYLVWSSTGSTLTGNKAWTNPTNGFGPPDGLYATAPFANAGEELRPIGYSILPQLGNITNVDVVMVTHTNGGDFNNAVLEFYLLTNSVQKFASNIVCTNFGNGNFYMNVTSAKSWQWSDFSNNAISNRLATAKNQNKGGVLDLDAVGYRITTDRAVGGSSGTTTIDPLPLSDTYDADLFQFLYADPPATSSLTSGTAPNTVGTIAWDNLGPLYAGGTNTVTVVFKALQPPNNTAVSATDTAADQGAKYLNGRPTNPASDDLTVTLDPTATLGDRVWRDLNNNAAQDSGEPGISGVTVTLTLPGGGSLSAVTDTNGVYLFEGLTNSGNYVVTINTNTLPSGFIQTFDPDGTLNHTTTLTNVNPAATDGTDTRLANDFGYRFTSTTIDGRVWNDLNRNGAATPEALEPMIAGVTVRLMQGASTLATTTTDANGYFKFTGAYNGSYDVVVDAATAPLGSAWVQTYDSNGLGTANLVTVSVVTGGTARADFSYYQGGTLTIGDTLFYDWNGNATQDATDEGIANITVYLYQDLNTNGVFEPSIDGLVATTSTSASGFYQFANLASGQYLVVVDEADPQFPPLYTMTKNPGEAGVCSTCNSYAAVNLTASTALIDFGYRAYGNGSIGDTVWFDANGNGAQSGLLETGIANITVNLLVDLNGDGTYVTLGSTATDANGHYLFSGLPDGAYRVQVDTNDPDLPKDAFGNRVTPSTATTYSTTLSNGNSYLNADFGFMKLAAVGDTIFWDANGNGTQDYSETGISGVTVRLYHDANSNRIFDAGDTLAGSTATDANGHYLFSQLSAGDYVVVVDKAGSPVIASATLTADPDADGLPATDPAATGCDNQYGMELGVGSSFMGADFGYLPLGVIGDTVWLDTNNNGVRDATETGLKYITVELRRTSDNSLVSTNSTDADGYYSFSNVSDGSYKVVVLTSDPDFPAGVAQTYDPDGTLDSQATVVLSGGVVTSIGGVSCSECGMKVDFGYRYSGNNALSGTVGLDGPNDNGVMGSGPSGVDADEAPFAGVTVYLYLWNDANSNSAIDSGEVALVSMTTTDSNGDYSFTGLPSAGGKYVVSLAAPQDKLRLTTQTGHTPPATSVVNTTDLLGETISAYQIVPIAGSTITGIDFAFAPTVDFDYGDLPSGYGTRLGDVPSGARHLVKASPDLYLGASVDAERNGAPSAAADGDGADEDGVAAHTPTLWMEGANGGSADVQVHGSGWLVAWMDFNHDGDFVDGSEVILSQSVSTGAYTVAFDIPTNAFTNAVSQFYARFRLFPAQPEFPEIAFSGEASNGEVEDYLFTAGRSNLISGTVYLDAGTSGWGGGDVPMAGVAVTLYEDTDRDGLYDAGEPLAASTATDGSGQYAFTGVPNGYYVVVETDPSGGFSVADTGGANDNQIGVSVIGADSTGNDFLDGGITLTSIAGQVREDRDNDANFADPDAGIGSVTVKLYSDSNANGLYDDGEPLVATTATSAGGAYSFSNLTTGRYVVVETDKSGFVSSADVAGANDNQIGVNLTAGGSTGRDFLDHDPTTPGTVTGHLYFDVNGNGVQNVGEPNLTNVTVWVTNSVGAVVTVSSDANGNWSASVIAGSTTAKVDTNDPDFVAVFPAGWMQTEGTDPTTVTAQPDTTVSAGNDGYYAPARLSGTIFKDSNRDLAVTGGEELSGVTVKLLDQLGAVLATFVTGASGQYSFTNLLPGTYTARVDTATLPPGLFNVVDPDATLDSQHTVTLAGGENRTGVNFGYWDSGITGRVYRDNDLDGLFSAGDVGIAGVSLQVTNAIGTVYSLTTDSDGRFSRGVAPGGWTIQIDSTNPSLNGLRLTTDAHGEGHTPASVTVPSGGTASHNFGYLQPTATLAVVSAMTAYRGAQGLVLEWRTASEVGTAGFDLYRQGAAAGEWVKVNPSLILATGSMVGHTYQTVDLEAATDQPAVYRLLELDAWGHRQALGPFRVAPQTGAPARTNVPVAEEAPLAPIPAPEPRQAAAGGAVPATPAPLADLGGVQRLKLITREAGVHRLEAATLAAALGQPIADVSRALAARELSLSTRGEAVGSKVAEDGSALYFYAEGLKNNYTQNNVYWLAWRPNPLLVASDGQAPAPELGTSYPETVVQETDALAVPTLVSDSEQDYWMWKKLSAGVALLDTASFSIALDQIAPSAGLPAVVKLRLLGANASRHTVRCEFNGQAVGQAEWQGAVTAEFVFSVPVELLREGPNQLRVRAVLAPGTSGSQWYVDRLEARYERRYLARGGRLEFAADGNAVVTIAGFASSDLIALEITDPKQPREVTRLRMSPGEGGLAASFCPPNPRGRYVVFQPASVPSVTALVLSQWADLAGTQQRADYLVVAPSALSAAADELVSYRQQQGLTAKAVTLEQIYDEFGAGLPSPTALRSFLGEAFHRWSTRPAYVVLVGNGTYDHRNLQGRSDNLMPPVMIPTAFGLFASDSIYGDVNSDGVPELAVGRLPATNTEALRGMIGKIKAYEARPAAVPPKALLVADRPDAGGDFPADMAAVQPVLSAKMNPVVLSVAEQPDLAATRAALQTSVDAGVDLVAYLGHGAVDRLGAEGYLTSADVPLLRNGNRLPVVVAGTCVSGQYAVPGYDSLAESLVLHSESGAVGIVAPSGLSWNRDAHKLNLRLVQALQANADPRLGDLVRRALGEYSRLDQEATPPWIYSLLGDPGLLYGIPKDPAPSPRPPMVAIAGPANSALSAPATLTLTADAFGLDGVVRRVEYYEGATKLGESSVYPFAVAVEGVAAGAHDYYARATDVLGSTADSAPLRITILAQNLPPSITLSATAQGSPYAPATVALEARAVDPDGAIARVEFYEGRLKIGESTQAPYSLVLSNLAERRYAFTAVAWDNHDEMARSSPVALWVLPFEFQGISVTDQQLTLRWAGGRPPYRIERRTSLDPNTSWEALSLPTKATNLTVPLSPFSGFFRVRSAE